jgi:hypothetical protein
MTDESRGIGGAVGPPWSVDVLADLHAGVLDEVESARLWPQVNADPEARAVIDALEATTDELSALADGPFEPMPAQFAARLDAAIAQEAGARQNESPVAPVIGMDAARRRRNKQLGWGAGLLVAAAAAVTLIVLPGSGGSTGPSVALPPAPGPSAVSSNGGTPALGGDGSGADALVGGGLGIRDFGPLLDEQHLDACLVANGFDPAVRPAGILPVTVGGQPGVMVMMTTGKFAQYRLVGFPASCGPGHPGKLFDRVVGEK